MLIKLIPLHSWLPGSNEGYVLIIILFTFLFFIFSNFKFFFEYLMHIILYFSANIYSLNLTCLSVLPAHLGRDKKGRFIDKTLSLKPLSSKLVEAMIGELLGDGHLRFNKKGEDGNLNLIQMLNYL